MLTVAKLMAGTKKLRGSVPNFTNVADIELSGRKLNRNANTIEYTAKIAGETEDITHKPQIKFYRVEAVDKKDEKHPVLMTSEDKKKKVYLTLPTTKSMVEVRCNCLTGNTKVLTTNGWKTLREIAEPITPDHYPIEYKINGEVHKGSAPFYKGVQGVWTIHLSNGKTVTATKDHKFLKYGGHKQKNIYGQGRVFLRADRINIKNTWVKLKNLQVGDKLVANTEDHHISTPIQTYELNEGFFIGVLMGDGSLFSSGKPDLALFKTDKEEILETLVKSNVVKGIAKVESPTSLGMRVQFNHRAKELMARFKYENKYSVNLSTRTQWMGYLAGLFVTDGSCDRGRIQIFGGYEYLDQLHYKLLEFGLHDSSLRLSRRCGTKTNLGRSTKDMWILTIGLQGTKKVLPYISDLLTDKKREGLNYKRIRENIKDPYVEILDIVYSGKTEVYDIMVPGVNRFVAEGVIAHNCSDYYFTWWKWNAEGGSNLGKDFPPYERKTSDRPPRNPEHYPGMCKHLIGLVKLLQKKKVLGL